MIKWGESSRFGPNNHREDAFLFSEHQLKLLRKYFKLHDESKDDADSIHSFDLNESVSRIVTNVIDGFHDFTQDDLRKVWIESGVRLPDGSAFGPNDHRKDALHFSLTSDLIQSSLFNKSLNCDDEFDDLDTQIKSLLTQWGDAEYDLFKKDMNKMKIHENGRYLSGTIIF